MPITLWPANAVAGAPSYTGRMLRQALGVLLGGATAARPLGGLSGVRPGSTGLVSATSTTWTVNPHAGALDLEASASAGPYLYSVDDATNTGSVTAADATNPRLDIVYATLSDPAEGDGSSAPGVAFGYLAGTPAATPAAPATPARSMLLSTISVPKVGSGSPTTSDAAPFTAAAGGIIPVRNLAARAALTAFKGLMVFRLDNNVVEVYDGGAWGGVSDVLAVAQLDLISFATVPVGTRLIRYSGSTVAVTSAGGHFQVTFPAAFPNGVLGITVSNGDDTAVSNVTYGRTSITTSSALFRVRSGSTGSTVNSTNMRVDFTVLGW